MSASDARLDPDELERIIEATDALHFVESVLGGVMASDEWQALDRFGSILDAAKSDPVIAKSEHVKSLVEYLADVFQHRYGELMRGDATAALREVVNEKQREISSRRRSNVTRETLLAYRDEYIMKRGKERGWKKSAQAAFSINAETLRNRLRSE